MILLARETRCSGQKKGTTMAKAPGRPKSTNPRVIPVKILLTAQEHDALLRAVGDGTISKAVRRAIEEFIWRKGGARNLPDTPRAMIARERRKAMRATETEDSALVEHFALEEPAADDLGGESQVFETHTGERIKARITRRTVAPGVVSVPVTYTTHDPYQRGPEQQPPE
jgi:hypothetical protein